MVCTFRRPLKRFLEVVFLLFYCIFQEFVYILDEKG